MPFVNIYRVADSLEGVERDAYGQCYVWQCKVTFQEVVQAENNKIRIFEVCQRCQIQ